MNVQTKITLKIKAEEQKFSQQTHCNEQLAGQKIPHHHYQLTQPPQRQFITPLYEESEIRSFRLCHSPKQAKKMILACTLLATEYCCSCTEEL